jgi:hypothetical protein
MIFKALPAENYLVRPFLTHKKQSFGYTFLSGSNPAQISIDLAVVAPTVAAWQFDPNTDPINPDGIYQRTLWSSLKNLYYSSGSIWNGALARTMPAGTLAVINIAQVAFGEKVRPGSVHVTTDSNAVGFLDDGKGQLTSASVPVGHIFYEQGIAVLPKSTLGLDTGSLVTVNFDSSYTIYEHTIMCTMEEGEYNYSFNPSVHSTGSVSGSSLVLDNLASGSLTPYITTVGLYTDRGELVALAKFPRPVKRATDSQQTVIVRFDV